MTGLEITKELKIDIEENQISLQNAIRNHQQWILKLKEHPFEEDLVFEVKHTEEQIVLLGLKQKGLLARLREEYQAYQKTFKQNVLKTALDDRKLSLSNALSKAKRHHLPFRPPSTHSYSDESEGRRSVNSSPEHLPKPTSPHEITQSKFLNYFCLATHDVFKEMQNKRAERRRRSTANPQFLYGSRAWDFGGPLQKRKRRQFLARPISPPNTRQSTRKRQGRTSPSENVSGNNGNHYSSLGFGNFSTSQNISGIPNLPSGLIIERVSSGSSSPDPKICNICKESGTVIVCEACSNGFHVICHDRPLTQTPRHCPKCIDGEKDRGNRSNTVYYLPTEEYADKLNQKKELEEKRQNLTAELTQLQHRHSQLTVSLRKQQTYQEKLLLHQQTTEVKVNQILQFIEHIKNSNLNHSTTTEEKIETPVTNSLAEDQTEAIENGLSEKELPSETHNSLKTSVLSENGSES